MERQLSDIEKIRQQFDAAPYPRIPLDQFPNDMKYLTLHSITMAYYLRYQKFVEAEGKVILDAGCGSGFKSLALAVANPGAKIVGIDLSEESTKLAQQRLQYHGFENVEFHALSIYDLSKLGMEFDYIHCDETLYLLPDITAGLQSMKAVLKPEGMIRANLHSAIQRYNYFRAQKFFKLMGFMDETPGELEIDQVKETMKALRNDINLKTTTWRPELEDKEEWYLANYLLQGDRGYTIPEMFAAIRGADLEFISMVNWHKWELLDLFQDPDNLPASLGMTLPELSEEQRLHLFELLHPAYRLLDFWCGHPNVATSIVPTREWTDQDWQEVLVHLPPSLRVSQVKEEILTCITEIRLPEISKYLPFVKESPLLMDSTVAALILPLFDGPQSMPSLVQRWQQIRPLDPVTLQPTNEAQAFEAVKPMLITLEQFKMLLLEHPSKKD